MSALLSPDGMYYWDGARWVSTMSPDGRYRWNGASWEPVPAAAWPPYAPAQPAKYEPTSWTRPLQLAAAGWYSISALFSLTIPFWMSSQMTQILNASLQQEQAQNPTLASPPPGFTNDMASMMQGVLWFVAIFSFAIAAVLVAGALKRWVWIFYVMLALLGLAVVGGPLDLVNLIVGPQTAYPGYSPPTWIYSLGIVSWVPSTALFVAMLVAVIKRGPWAMRKVSSGGWTAA